MINPETTFLIGFAMIITMKIVVFILGYLIIRMGYKLLLSGVEGKFKFSANLKGFKADLVSVSPGLLFVLLGVILICIAIYIDKPITVKYLNGLTMLSAPETAPPTKNFKDLNSKEKN